MRDTGCAIPNNRCRIPDTGCGIGGRMLVNEIEKDTRISAVRIGLVYALPLSIQHALKVTLTNGVRFEKGPDFDAIGLTYQFMWGG